MDYMVKFSLSIPSDNFGTIANTVFDIFNDPATRIDLAGIELEDTDPGTLVTVAVAVTDATPGAALNRVKTYLTNAGQDVNSLARVTINRTDMEPFI